jgi:hypothetical protein
VSQGYYWTNNELQQGVSWMFLMYGTLIYLSEKSRTHSKPYYFIASVILFSALSFLAIFTHPGVIFPLLFLWAFYWLDHRVAPFNTKSSIFYFLIIVAVSGIKYYYSTANYYDSQLTVHILKSSPEDYLKTFTSGTADRFWKSIVRGNFVLPVIFISSLVYLIINKKYLLFTYLVVANLTYFVILCITYTAEVDFYIENEFMPFAIFGSAVFVYYQLPAIKNAKKVTLLLGSIYAIRILFIGLAAGKFIDRSNQVDEVLAYMRKEGKTKLVLIRDNDLFEKEIVHTSWGLPYESMLHSELNGDSSTLSFVHIPLDQAKGQQAIETAKEIFTEWGHFGYNALNKHYFTPDTMQRYILKSYQEVFKRAPTGN